MSAKFQCPYCGVGCGLLMVEGRVRGDKDHPANFGDVCKKPLYYPKVMNNGRLLKPMYRQDKKEPFVEIDWGTAYEILRQKLTEIERRALFLCLGAVDDRGYLCDQQVC